MTADSATWVFEVCGKELKSYLYLLDWAQGAVSCIL